MNKRHEKTKKGTQMAMKHMKWNSIPLATMEIKMKTTMRYHHLPLRVAKMRNSGSIKCWQGFAEYTAGGNVKGYCRLENSLAISSKTKHTTTTHPTTALVDIYPREIKS